MYLSTPEQWRLAEKEIRRKKICGLDTEFFGVNLKEKESCVGRAQVHVWSAAVLTDTLTARGHLKAKGIVLPVQALDTFRNLLEDPEIIKVAHTANVDAHALGNGRPDLEIRPVNLQGVVDLLSLAKWVMPNRFKHGLDALGTELLGYGKFISYDELVNEEYHYTETKEKLITKKRCGCGVVGCRQRSLKYDRDGQEVDHRKKVEFTESELIQIEKTGIRQIPLKDIVPGHPRFETLVKYAQQDAVVDIEVYDFLMRDKTQTEIPWYGGNSG